jgi:hypothetical protein
MEYKEGFQDGVTYAREVIIANIRQGRKSMMKVMYWIG